MFFAPQDNNKYRIRCFLVQSLSFPARREGGTALHTHVHPLAGKFVSEHTGTSYRLLNAGSTFYPNLIKLSVKENVVQQNTKVPVFLTEQCWTVQELGNEWPVSRAKFLWRSTSFPGPRCRVAFRKLDTRLSSHGKGSRDHCDRCEWPSGTPVSEVTALYSDPALPYTAYFRVYMPQFAIINGERVEEVPPFSHSTPVDLPHKTGGGARRNFEKNP